MTIHNALRLFQSTLPHGSDCRAVNSKRLPKISIHAPSRERRHAAGGAAAGLQISIHAPSRERLSSAASSPAASVFQSTLPHGSDQLKLFNPLHRQDFNPRSLTGATQVIIHTSFCYMHFNPRSLTGATKVFESGAAWNTVFQSTLPHGSDVSQQPTLH